jgi:long-chain acyl-CoA synthetase
VEQVLFANLWRNTRIETKSITYLVACHRFLFYEDDYMATLTTTKPTKAAIKTPLEMFYALEQSQRDTPYLHQPIDGQWHVWTWGEVGDEARRMAAYLQSQGLAPGSKVALLSRNCAHWIMSDFTIMMAGYVSVPIYPNVKAETVEYILAHSESQALLVGKLEDHDWQQMRKGIPDDMVCVSFGRYGLDCDYETWDDIVARQAPMRESPTFTPDDTMTIIYTSGTTGLPKGVVHKFRSPVFSITYFDHYFHLRPSDRFFSYLPLSHIAERMLITMGTLVGGSTIHFAQSLDTFAEDLKTCNPTLFLGVPRIWSKFQSGVLSKFPQKRLDLLFSIPLVGSFIKGRIREALGLSKVRVALSGAAPIPVSLLEWFHKVGITIHEVYGMTENSAYSHANRPGEIKFGTVGRDLPFVETKITEEGEICFKSDANMVAYYKDPEKTADTIRDGWLHSGDKGKFDEDGYLRITGRVKDLFKTSKAKYVAPSPIEMQLSKNEFIEMVCVVGHAIPQPLALVVLNDAARSADADRSAIEGSLLKTLKEVNGQLEHHELLHHIVVAKDEWSTENGILTPSLKIKRGEIDDRYSDRYEGWYEQGKGKIIWEK